MQNKKAQTIETLVYVFFVMVIIVLGMQDIFELSLKSRISSNAQTDNLEFTILSHRLYTSEYCFGLKGHQGTIYLPHVTKIRANNCLGKSNNDYQIFVVNSTGSKLALIGVTNKIVEKDDKWNYDVFPVKIYDSGNIYNGTLKIGIKK